MRDLLLIGVIGASLLVAIRYPFAGLLTWAWFTIMSPHQLAYGVFGIPLNLVIAGVTCTAFLFSHSIAKIRVDAVSLWLIIFALWLTISQAFSLDANASAIYYDRFIKTLLFALMAIQLTNSRLRLHALLWILVAGVGFFAAKGGLFTLVTLGEYRVQGLENTVLEDNNHFGIATATLLPLILYLRSQSAAPIVRHGLACLFVLAIIAIIGTHSRGAFLCLALFTGFYWLHSKSKLAILTAMLLVLTPTIAFMPAKWGERMGTIGEASHDASFMGRVDAWVINTKLANTYPLTGAGLRNPYKTEIAATVDPERAVRAKAAHSIYFEVLGGSGYVGLAIYLMLLASAFGRLEQSGGQRRRGAESAAPWLPQFGAAARLSLTIFLFGGLSTSMEMWDGYLLLIALAAAARRLARSGDAQADQRRRAPGPRNAPALIRHRLRPILEQ